MRFENEVIKELTELLENLPNGVCSYYFDGNNIFPVKTNKKLYEIMGYSSDKKENKICGFKAIHQDDVDRVKSHIYNVLKTGGKSDITYRMYNAKKQEYIIVNSDITVKKNSDETAMLFVTYVDISEKISKYSGILKENNNMSALIESKTAESRAKSEFLSKFGHDMRTPMNAILTFSEIAKYEENPELVKEYLKMINSSGKYLMSLLNNVLDIERIENHTLELHPQNANLNTVFNEIINSVKPMIKEKSIKFHLSFDYDIYDIGNTFYFDVYRVKQIFTNLFSNSVKFTQNGGDISFHVNIANISGEIATICFSIKDTGCVMSKSLQENMFKPFYKEQSSLNCDSTGTGLGLAIVKQIIDEMNGKISCNSTVGLGTEFMVELPIKICKPVKDTKENTVISDEILKNKRILLCEDQSINAVIAQKVLSKKGVLVETARDGACGVKMFEISENGYYDMILMDISMPIMDGLEASKKIRASNHPQASSIPIIAVSGNTLNEDVEKTKDVGMNAFLSKPINIESLYKTMSNLCVK